MIVSFAACKKQEVETTTLASTMPFATTKATESGQSAEVSNNAAGMTMILTTAHGETMPTVVTTLFNLANEITNAIDVNPDLTVGSMDIPPVSTSEIPTLPSTDPLTVPTLPSDNSTEVTEPIDRETTTQNESQGGSDEPASSEENVDPVPKTVEIGSTATSSAGKVVIDFNPSGWNGGVKTKKISIITVEYDGHRKSVNGSVIGISDNADNAQIIINTDDLKIPEGANATITIPAGAVVSRKGDQISREISSQVTF